MRHILRILFLILSAGLALAGCTAGAAAGEDISAVQAGASVLAPCPKSPNCVYSGATDADHQIAAFPLQGSPEESLAKLHKVLEAQPRTVITLTTPTHLHAEVTTMLMRFVDDLDFVYDDASKQIQVRSASRVGYSDLGVNRKRVEALRAAYLR